MLARAGVQRHVRVCSCTCTHVIVHVCRVTVRVCMHMCVLVDGDRAPTVIGSDVEAAPGLLASMSRPRSARSARTRGRACPVRVPAAAPARFRAASAPGSFRADAVSQLAPAAPGSLSRPRGCVPHPPPRPRARAPALSGGGVQREALANLQPTVFFSSPYSLPVSIQ